MARPIKETPILSGEDAVRFRKEMENIKPVSREEKRQALELYEAIREKANFAF